MSDLQDLSFDDFDKWRRPPPTITDFDRVLATAMSRRGVLRAGVGAGATALALSGSAMVPLAAMASSRFAFEAVRASTLDTVTVPDGYQWDVLTRWGDPLWSDGAAFDQQSRGTAASQRRAVGDNNDGMGVFSKDGRHVLAVNNEYVNRDILHGNRADNKPVNADDVAKSKAAHGVSVMEIVPDGDGWAVQLDSDLNRRITADTPMQLTGPAAGHDLLKTAADPSGTKVLGTFNNCGYGQTPWGTYLTCEENFNGYFSASDDTFDVPDDFKRYGIGKKDRGYAWAMADERFDIAKHPNEPNRFGYVVEIDPLNPTSMPKKRTALGRFKHENAALVIAESGHVVVYLGDDERGEFLYKFVSRDRYQPAGDNAELLADGTLYVAKFNDDQTGRWIALTPETTGMASKAEICVHTRQAASAVGATTMDRPEWVAAHPMRAEAYVALTNNKNRGKKPNKGGDATPVGGPNPRAENNYGQIVRWRPADGDHTQTLHSLGIFLCSPETRSCTKTLTAAQKISTRKICSIRRTASPSTAWAICGFRPTVSIPTKATLQGRVTTKCCRPTPTPAKFAVSWSGPKNAKSRGYVGHPTNARCLWAFSIRAKKAAVIFRTAATPYRDPASSRYVVMMER